MMAQLIQPSEVVQGGIARPAPTDVRMDQMLLAPHVKDAEYRWIIPITTQDFYDYLTADKGSSSAFTDPAYQALWDAHLKELCAAAVLYEAAPYITVQAGSTGLYVHRNEYGDNVGIDGVKFYQDTLRQRIEVKQKRMHEWLCTCAADLTGFQSSALGCPDDDCDDDDSTDYLYNTFGVVL